jgi:hypothetical protein
MCFAPDSEQGGHGAKSEPIAELTLDNLVLCPFCPSHRKGDFADESLSAPIEMRVPFLLGNHLLNDPSAEAFMRRLLHQRATRLLPAQVQLSVALL